jgi:hypothetical protein
MCKVMNARQVGKRPATDRVYVGHPSKWGNPRDTARGSCGSRRSICTNCAARIWCAYPSAATRRC